MLAFLFSDFCTMRSHSYINTAKNIIELYNGIAPLSIWLKQFFKENKKYGSKDRKEIAHYCYSFYRLGNAFKELPIDERILTGVFLSSTTESFILQELRPEWNGVVSFSLKEKIIFLEGDEEIKQLFAFNDELSSKIDPKQLGKSFLIQPLLYLRIRPNKKNSIIKKLGHAAVDFETVNDNCISLPNSTKLGEVIELNKEAVVQDFNSQRIAEFFQLPIAIPKTNGRLLPFEVWDCCAASGGKSILMYDTFSSIKLTVSDIRKSILHNLKKRFQQAGIDKYKSFIADNSSPTFSLGQKFDLVICDAPCSGSGTWSRTPEQLYFFQKEKITYYSDLQKRIVINTTKNVKDAGYFLYITCSVFKKENEELADFIQMNTSLKLIKKEYFIGYDKKADTLFAALFARKL